MIESRQFSGARPLLSGWHGGSRSRRSTPGSRLPAALILLALLLLAAPARAEGSAYLRDLQVPAAGWVRAPLDLAALRHMAPAGADLHLFGPGGAAVPFRIEEVQSVAGAALAVAAQGARCDRGPSSSRVICSLDIPPGQIIRRLRFELEGSGAVGYRLHEPREARWELLAEGVWQTAGERSRHELAGGREPVAGSTLRLEIHGPEGTSPGLLGYALELALTSVVFEARQPGRYVLAYGGAAGGSTPEGRRPPDPAQALWVVPGPEMEQPLQPLPASPGAPLEGNRFSASWPVAAPDAAPGELVRLELPAGIYEPAGEDLEDLRLAAGGRQIPFYRWSPPTPLLTAEDLGSQPVPADETGESRVVISLPASGLPLTQMHLTAPGVPLRRRVTVRYLDPGRRRDEAEAARSIWICAPEAPLPCRKAIGLEGPGPRLLTVRVHDGDNPPLPGLDVAVWRRRDLLIFAWPALESGEEVRLLAGARGLEPPGYDLAALGPALLGYPWKPAAVLAEGTAPGGPPWWSEWAMPLAVTAALIGLLLLLRRILTEA